MNFSRLLTLIFAAISSLFLLLFGLFILVLPWSHSALELAVSSVQEYRWFLTFFGISLLLVGVAIIGQIYLASQRKYLTIKTGDNPVYASDAVVRDSLQAYWENLFPEQEIPCRVDIKKNRIFLYVDLPYYPKEKRPELLKKVEAELAVLLQDLFAYSKSLNLKISFDREHQTT
jgi:hypothetical protein